MPIVSQNKRWEIYPPQPSLAKELAEALKINPLTAQVLINRGFNNPDLAHAFLNPSLENLPNPFLMKDMEKAVLRLEEALKRKERITIYGDYDVDGTTGSSLLYLFFTELQGTVDVYIPHRVQEGYGLNIKALEHLKKEGSQLVVTVDNGISSVAEAEKARELGLDLIIIDHHQVPPKIPFATAILNPKQEDCSYPSKELAGVGVAFQFALALRNHLRKQGYFQDRKEPTLKKYLDLVTLGTIADLVPLTGLNRILVKLGLEVLSESKNLGVQALKEVAGVSGKITPGQVGFRLGPRINAAGRLSSAKVGFDLLTSSDLDQARVLAKQLDIANQERQALEMQIVEEACERIEQEGILQKKCSILVCDPKWHLGVIGIVASRLVDRYYLPAIVGTVEAGKLRCSARSISGLDLYKALQACEIHLEKFGGHRQAAGLTFLEEKKEVFWQAFDQKVKDQLSAEQFIPFVRVDAEIEPNLIQKEFIEELQTLAPFGQGNPEPVFWAKNLTLFDQQQVGSNHLRFKFKGDQYFLEAIGFKMAGVDFTKTKQLMCLFSCQFNEWNGRKQIQLRLVDFPRPKII